MTASSGQSAVDLNKTAVDIEDKTVSARISEMTQVLTQAALQVKHEAAIVPALNKGIATISKLNTNGDESFNDFLENRQKVFSDMGMPEGYSRRFAEAAYESAAMDPLYGDTNGSVADASKDIDFEPNINHTLSKSEVTQASSPLALLSYNGARYLKDLAKAHRSLYEGEVSGKLVQALPATYNKNVPDADKIPENASKIATEYYTVNKQTAQRANRDIRDKSFEVRKPLVKLDDLAKLLPSKADVKKMIKGSVEMIDNMKIEQNESEVALSDIIKAQMGRIVPRPNVQNVVPVEAASATVTRDADIELQR